MSRKNVTRGFVITYLLIVALYLSKASHEFESVIFLLPPLLASILGFYAAHTYKLENIHGRSMAFLASGLGFFFAGELMFFIYEFFLNSNPFPSIADIFYLTAYPLLLWGLMIEVKMHKPKFSDFSKQTLTLMFTALGALFGIVVYFGIFKAYDSDASGLANFIAMSYGIADLVILIPAMYVLNLAYEFKGGKLFNSWILIFFAILFMLLGDILFASYSDLYSTGTWPYNLIDLAWTASYLLFGYSFYYTATCLKELRAKLLNSKTDSSKTS